MIDYLQRSPGWALRKGNERRKFSPEVAKALERYFSEGVNTGEKLSGPTARDRMVMELPHLLPFEIPSVLRLTQWFGARASKEKGNAKKRCSATETASFALDDEEPVRGDSVTRETEAIAAQGNSTESVGEENRGENVHLSILQPRRGIEKTVRDILCTLLERQSLSTLKGKEWLAIVSDTLKNLNISSEKIPSDKKLLSFLSNMKTKFKKRT